VVRAIILTVVTIVTFSAFGCAGAQRESEWVHTRGELVYGTCLERAERLSALFDHSIEKNTQIHVLDSNTVGAFGWPNGDLFLTRGLMELLNDDEVAAAIAHELGHLFSDGWLRTMVSLRGCCTNPDREQRADAIGARLLEQRGIGRVAMISMLTKVRSSLGVPAFCGQAIGRRLQLLSDSSAVDSQH
jgi:Zn-dependent protease with chaperone function